MSKDFLESLSSKSMKTLHHSLLVCFVLIMTLPHLAFAQRTEYQFETIQIQPERQYSLNGTTRSDLGFGNDRTVINFNLPENTVQWYYSFSTSKNQAFNQSLNLAGQLISIYYSGNTSLMPKVPAGESSIDAYLMQSTFHQYFLNNNSFNYYPEGSLLNVTQGVVKVTEPISGDLTIGLKNLSALSGIGINIEITAIVRKLVYIDEWTTESEVSIKEQCIENHLTSSSAVVEVCACCTEKIQSAFLPSKWNTFSANTKSSIVLSNTDLCYSETGNNALKQAELNKTQEIAARQEKLDMLFGEIRDLWSKADALSRVGDYQSAMKLMLTSDSIMDANPQYLTPDWSIYNSTAWYALLAHEFDVAKDYLAKGLALQPMNMYLNGNLGLYHLIHGDVRKAMIQFNLYKRKEKFPSGLKWIDVISEDLEILESIGLGNEHFAEVREQLRIR